MIFEQIDVDFLISDVSEKVSEPKDRTLDSLVRWARKSIRKNENDVLSIHLMSAKFLVDADPNAALKQLQEPTDAVSGHATGHRIAGYALLQQKRVKEAFSHFDAAVRLDPFLNDCWYQLGKISIALGRVEQAEVYFERGSLVDDSRHRCAVACAKLQLKKNSLSRAIKTIQKSLERDRRSAVLNFELAGLLCKRATVFFSRKMHGAQSVALRKAMEVMKVVIASSPTSKHYFFLGIIQKRLKLHAESQRSFERAAETNPNSAMPITQIASLCVDNGQIDRAIGLFEKSMKLDNRCASTHFRYTRAKKFKWNSETRAYVDQLRELVEQRDKNRHQEIQLSFALAKVLDDSGQHDEAWKYYDRANRLKTSHIMKSQSAQQSISAHRDRVDASVGFFKRSTIERFQLSDSRGVTPVFIVGMPRSGTTLTEQILSSHPSIFGAGELQQIGRIRQTLVDNFRSQLQDNTSPKAYPELLCDIDSNRLVDVAAKHRSYLRSLCEQESHVVDKMPTNFGNLGLIAMLFPDAKIIHLRRNPMDVLVSCYCQNLNAPFCDLAQLTEYHRQYRRLMEHWERELPMPILTVDYEDLVANPEHESRRLIEHCGLEWNESCLNFHQTKRSVHTPSKWQVRQPMYSTSVAKWKRFESHLQDVVQRISA